MKANIKSYLEKSIYVHFLTNCFSSFEENTIVDNVYRICSFPMWLSIDENLINAILNDKNTPKKLSNQYEQIKKNKKKLTENEMNFMRVLIEDFLDSLKNFDLKENKDENALIYFERFLEFVIDMLSQIPTRRFFKFMVESLHVEEQCRLAPLYSINNDANFLFHKLMKLLNFYLRFEVNEFSGESYTETQVSAYHASDVSRLQRVAFKNFPEKLRTLSLSNVSSFDNRELLYKHVSQLEREELLLLCHKLNIIGKSETEISHELLLEIFVSRYERKPSRIDAINEMPIYPTEEIFWDQKMIPDHYEFNSQRPLALPKLNLQFLSFYDFLLRSYNLYRLESAYEIKNDLEKVITRLNPKVIEHILSPTPVVRFHGWSRNAIPIKDFSILYASKPKLGQDKPGSVVATIKFSIKNFKGRIKEEWEDLRVHDVLYLLYINEPPSNPGKSLNFGEKHGLVYARGCEVIEFRDERDRVIDNEVPNKEFVPAGTMRTLKVKLDNSQYQMDELKKLDPSPYKTFNCVMKRKRKENNFKAVLQTIKNLINQVSEQTISVPDWLKDVFLGYGEPKNIRNVLPTDSFINYHDSFLSREHFISCFPNHKIKEENKAPQSNFHTLIKLSKDNKELTVKYEELPKEREIKFNPIPFTPTQVSALSSCINEGLTMIVGPPGKIIFSFHIFVVQRN